MAPLQIPAKRYSGGDSVAKTDSQRTRASASQSPITRSSPLRAPRSSVPVSRSASGSPCVPPVFAPAASNRSGSHAQAAGREGVVEQPQLDDPGELDALNEVIMAVNLTNSGTIGCAYYVARSETLYFMEDLKACELAVLDSLKLFIDPTVVLVPANCAPDIVEYLNRDMMSPNGCFEDGVSFDQSHLPLMLECRPSSEFGYEASRNKLVNLRIGQRDGPWVTLTVPGDVVSHDRVHVHGDNDVSGRQGQLFRLSGWINVESKVTVGCAGAVLAYVQRRRAAAYLPGDSAADSFLRVETIEMFTLAESLFVNYDTLLSLQIFSTESHPNAQQQGPASKGWSSGGTKEGLSVYGLFHHLAKTPQGRILLRKCFLRPSMNLKVINERLDSVSALLLPENSDCLERLVKSLAKVKNMRVATVNLRKGISSSPGGNRLVPNSIWPNLRHFVFHALRITDIIFELHGADRLMIVHSIRDAFDKRLLAEIGALIGEVVDLEASQEQRRTVVLPGVDAELDEFRRTYEGLEDLLSRAAEHIADRVPAELDSDINVIFFPQIGFLTTVRLDVATRSRAYEGLDDDPWDRMFVTESAAYYKNAVTTELDRAFGDVYGRMCDREIEIVQRLSERILEYEDLLNSVSDICGELDCLTALARGALQYNLSRPQVKEQNVLSIREGRHILQELTVPAFVMNDTCLEGGSGNASGDLAAQSAIEDPSQRRGRTATPSTIILTGPNYSGKSIYLKQVAIITYMAHVGSFVPAESAEIGLTDKILTRIATRESVSRPQSAFMIDLQQISLALKLATRRSLVIIDEFGKGTEAGDGAGLAAGVFEHLLLRGSEAPKVLGATHFHEIFESGFLAPRPTLAFAHMEVKVDLEATDHDRQITYLYTYRPGRSTKSFGTYCAAINGVPSTVIQRAEDLIRLAARGENLVEACAELPEDELAELEDAEQIARDFLAVEIDDEPRRVLEDVVFQTRSMSLRVA